MTGGGSLDAWNFTSPGASFPSTYLVPFTESGLPSGTRWRVNITGEPAQCSVGPSISIKLPNGTYQYTVATSDKEYRATGGSFTVSGSSLGRSVSFTLVIYAITIRESGLPSGTEWWVNLTNGAPFHATTDTIAVSEPNGTYAYTIGTDSGYRADVASGNVTVAGTSTVVSVTFRSTSAGGRRLVAGRTERGGSDRPRKRDRGPGRGGSYSLPSDAGGVAASEPRQLDPAALGRLLEELEASRAEHRRADGTLDSAPHASSAYRQ